VDHRSKAADLVRGRQRIRSPQIAHFRFASSLESMKHTRRMAPYALLAVLNMLLAACSNRMDPAQQALASANNAVTAAAADAREYMPVELSALGGRLSDLNRSSDMKDYAAVLRGAAAIVADAQRLGRAAADRKQVAMTALNARWSDIALSLPDLLDRVQLRIDALSKISHAPKGVDLTAAKSAITDANAIWQKAQISFVSGKLEEAVGNAEYGKTRAEAAATSINLNPPAIASAAR